MLAPTYNTGMKTVILTNEEGVSLDNCEILKAHTNGGKLHKAFSVFVFTPDKAKLLIQKRALSKLLFAGFWANTCCSHPKEKAPIEVEAAKRLQEECGFRCPLTALESFVYKADDPNGNGTEYEYDTILVGTTVEDTPLNPNPEEVAGLQWIDITDLKQDMSTNPEIYAPWFHTALPRVLND